jgi:hypothetical protein
MSDKIKEKTSEDRIFGSYLFINYANKGKIEKAEILLQNIEKLPKIYLSFYGTFSLKQVISLTKRK